MRVIAGSAGGIPLRIPRSQLRPTMDVVKGAIFSSLADAVPGARVFDLFAGSGGLGIEALSRGAAGAVFVEQDGRACQCIEENLRKTRLSGTVRRADVFQFLRPETHPWKAHLIFADPPYAKGPDSADLAAKLVLSAKLPLLAEPEACLILEVPSGWQLPPDSQWQSSRRKHYGATDILFLHALSAPSARPSGAEASRQLPPGSEPDRAVPSRTA